MMFTPADIDTDFVPLSLSFFVQLNENDDQWGRPTVLCYFIATRRVRE